MVKRSLREIPNYRAAKCGTEVSKSVNVGELIWRFGIAQLAELGVLAFEMHCSLASFQVSKWKLQLQFERET